jgi:hypothetical protein
MKGEGVAAVKGSRSTMDKLYCLRQPYRMSHAHAAGTWRTERYFSL